MGYAVWGRLTNRVVVPVRDVAGRLLSYSARAIDDAMVPRYDAGRADRGASPRRALWGEEFWGEVQDCVTVAEGVFSGIRLAQAGAPNATALLGSYLTEEKARVLSRFRQVLIATDPDPAGERVAEWISLLGRRADVVAVPLDASPDDVEVSELAERVAHARSLFR
jgi:DNA primase